MSKEFADKTTWIGTQLENEDTQWIAFPAVKLDGETTSIVISAGKFDLAYMNPSDRSSYGVMPTSGLYLLKERDATPNSRSTKDGE